MLSLSDHRPRDCPAPSRPTLTVEARPAAQPTSRGPEGSERRKFPSGSFRAEVSAPEGSERVSTRSRVGLAPGTGPTAWSRSRADRTPRSPALHCVPRAPRTARRAAGSARRASCTVHMQRAARDMHGGVQFSVATSPASATRRPRRNLRTCDVYAARGTNSNSNAHSTRGPSGLIRTLRWRESAAAIYAQTAVFG